MYEHRAPCSEWAWENIKKYSQKNATFGLNAEELAGGQSVSRIKGGGADRERGPIGHYERAVYTHTQRLARVAH